MRLMLTAFVVLCISASAALPEGAIVVGRSYGGGWGAATVYDRTTRADAVRDAMASCQAKGYDCHLATAFNKLCFAVTKDVTNGLTWKTAPEQHQASNGALAGCKMDCYVATYGCDSISETEIQLEQQQRAYEQAEQERRRQQAEQDAESARQQALAEQQRKDAEERDRLWKEQRQHEAKLAMQEAETDRLQRERDAANEELRKQQADALEKARRTEWHETQARKAGTIIAIALGFLFFYETRARWKLFFTSMLIPASPPALTIETDGEPEQRSVAIVLPVPLPAQMEITTAPIEPIKTEAAVRALKIAHSYISEIDAPYQALVDPDVAKQYLQTVTLAARQIAIAEANDPSARYRSEQEQVDKGISDLKAEALHIEAICNMLEHRKKGLKILDQAIALRPDLAHYHYAAAVLWADTDRRRALKELEIAVALDPDELTYVKDLDRMKNVSLSERFVASGMKVAHGAVATTRKTLNVLWWLQMFFRWGLMIAFVVCLAIQNWPGAAATFLLMMIIGMFLKAKDHAVDKVNQTLGRR